MSFQPFDLIPNDTTETGSASGGSVAVAAGSMGAVEIDIDAQTAINPLSVWLEHSSNNIDFYEVPADLVMKNAGSVAAGGVVGAGRNIVNAEVGAAAVAKYSAIYKHLPAGYVRLRWFMSGTSFRFKRARMSVK